MRSLQVEVSGIGLIGTVVRLEDVRIGARGAYDWLIRDGLEELGLRGIVATWTICV